MSKEIRKAIERAARRLEEDVAATRLEDLIGCTGYQGPAKSLEEMEAGVAEGARCGPRHERFRLRAW